jgi:hypothetical protein
LARRETSELPQRLSLLQAKRDRQARLLAEKHELLALCQNLEADIQAVEDRVTKVQQQEETVELRRLGLEMTMELQRKRFEEQLMQLRFERERLDQWEQRVKGRG